MNKFIIFYGLSSIIYWLITGDINFYKIANGIWLVLLGFLTEMSDYWKREATKYHVICKEICNDVDTVFGEGAAEKLLRFNVKKGIKRLKELAESGKEIPDFICKDLEKMKAKLEK